MPALGWILLLICILAVPAVPAFILGNVRVSLRKMLGVAIVDVAVLVVVQSIGLIDGDRGGPPSLFEDLFLIIWLLAGLVWIVGVSHSVGVLAFQRRALGFAPLAPLVLYLLAAPATWAEFQMARAYSTKSDTAMIEHFRSHEAVLHDLTIMLEHDRGAVTICDVTYAHQPKLPPERLAEYHALLTAAGIRYGLTRDYRSEVRFRYWAAGGWSNSEQGYAFRPGQPEPLVDSLDGGHGSLAYRHLTDDWYLYYHHTDSVRGPCT